MAAESNVKVRPEAWVAAAWLAVVAEFAIAIVLGLKRPGAGAVKVFLYGPLLLSAIALAIGAFGLIWSFVRRPFAQTQRIVAFCLLGFVIATATYPLPFPASRSARPSAARVRFPLAGEWTTAWGGEDEMNQMLRTRPDRRFGFYFVLARDGATRADPADPRSAFAMHQAVSVPADGEVVRVVDSFPDDGARRENDLGNHVVIELAPGEFLFVGGLAQGSCAVQVGQRVTWGEPLGKIGFSAWSPVLPEPHLALHVQDTPEPIWGQGIPFYFFESAIDGERRARAVPNGKGFFVGRKLTGERITHAP